MELHGAGLVPSVQQGILSPSRQVGSGAVFSWHPAACSSSTSLHSSAGAAIRLLAERQSAASWWASYLMAQNASILGLEQGVCFLLAFGELQQRLDSTKSCASTAAVSASDYPARPSQMCSPSSVKELDELVFLIDGSPADAKEVYELHFKHGVAVEVLKQLVSWNGLPSEQKGSAATKEVGCCLAYLVMFSAGCFPANGCSRAL